MRASVSPTAAWSLPSPVTSTSKPGRASGKAVISEGSAATSSRTSAAPAEDADDAGDHHVDPDPADDEPDADASGRRLLALLGVEVHAPRVAVAHPSGVQAETRSSSAISSTVSSS